MEVIKEVKKWKLKEEVMRCAQGVKPAMLAGR